MKVFKNGDSSNCKASWGINILWYEYISSCNANSPTNNSFGGLLVAWANSQRIKLLESCYFLSNYESETESPYKTFKLLEL